MNSILLFLTTIIISVTSMNASSINYEADKKFEKTGKIILNEISKRLRYISKKINLFSMKFKEEEIKILNDKDKAIEFLKKKYEEKYYLPLIEKNKEYYDGITEEVAILYARNNINDFKNLKDPVINNAQFVQECLMKIREYLSYSLVNQITLHNELLSEHEKVIRTGKISTKLFNEFRIIQLRNISSRISGLKNVEFLFISKHEIKTKFNEKSPSKLVGKLFSTLDYTDYSVFPNDEKSYPKIFEHEFEESKKLHVFLNLTINHLIKPYIIAFKENNVFKSDFLILEKHFTYSNDNLEKNFSIDLEKEYKIFKENYAAKKAVYTMYYLKKKFPEINHFQAITVGIFLKILDFNESVETIINYYTEKLDNKKLIEKSILEKSILEKEQNNKEENIKKLHELNTKTVTKKTEKVKSKYSFKKTTLKTLKLINKTNTNKIKWNHMLAFFKDLLSQGIILDVNDEKNTLKVKFSPDMQSTFHKAHGKNKKINDPKMLKKISSNFYVMGINESFIDRYIN